MHRRCGAARGAGARCRARSRSVRRRSASSAPSWPRPAFRASRRRVRRPPRRRCRRSAPACRAHRPRPHAREQVVRARQPDERHRHLLELAAPAADIGEPAELRGQQQRGVDVAERHRVTFRDRHRRRRTLRQGQQQPCALVVDRRAPRRAVARRPDRGSTCTSPDAARASSRAIAVLTGPATTSARRVRPSR